MRWSVEYCRERFARSRVARLATADAHGQPHLVPVTFAVLGQERDTVATAVDHKPKRTRNLKRLANITANPRVSLLADEYSEDWHQLWWVRADGTARIVTHGEEWHAAVRELRERYRHYRDTPPQGPVVLIEVRHWSGWSFR
ncbi:PPOX class probable F420-dependent enzyme [Haloactinospora alba]|uniref:PPOX class probable F420-dependent enzyme n=1 Tax=Haloactinospora alba TaxID=405555 RepID=A0A543N9Q5_9ACTN|nr:TIGR03668 family PPOX class F420-dependent oxidoreductase [Haloactinospora alba]TQN28551.1 PPOX class probable F420-dependent enzyme [Haloactinospora alba]